MSKENQRTLSVYEYYARDYLSGNARHVSMNPAEASFKREELRKRLTFYLKRLPEHPTVLEIGSASGEDALMLERLGCRVQTSDAAQSFVDILTERGFNPIKLDVLKDRIPGRYDCIYAWRVFVHFTRLDTERALRRMYTAIRPGGMLVFNVQNVYGEDGKSDGWKDFAGEYHLGETRFYHYWNATQLIDLVEEYGFRVKYLDFSGGDDDMRWINICARRP